MSVIRYVLFSLPFGISGWVVAPTSIIQGIYAKYFGISLSEIIDYGKWKHGSDQGATCFSVFGLTFRCTFALGSALGLAVAGWYGFDTTSVNQSEDGVFGMLMAISWLPGLFAIGSLAFVYMSPINSRRYNIIRRMLDAGLIRAEQ